MALVVQFRSPSLELLDAAAFIDLVAADFPKKEERPPQPPMEERFDPPRSGPAIQWEMIDRLPMPRFWLLSDDESRLIQLQGDLIALNWRRREDAEGDYPHYEALREDFRGYLDALEDLMKSRGKGAIEPTWCELTYVNHIEASPQSDEGVTHAPLSDSVTFASPLSAESFLPPPEDGQATLRFQIREDGAPAGRLVVTTTSAYRASDNVPIWVMQLVVRLRILEETLGGAIDRLDLAHRWVVAAFKDMTTVEMHKEWGLEGATQ